MAASKIRAWLRAQRETQVAEMLRRGLDPNRPPIPWFMYSVRSTSEAWLHCEEVASRAAAIQRGEHDRIRAEAAAERTREIADILEADAKMWREYSEKLPAGSIDRHDCRRRASYAETRANVIRSRYPDAFPAPKPETDHGG